MESRVMGNCHARFGAGENLEERVCSLRLHTPTKGLPIAILRDCCGSDGEQAAGAVYQVPDCGAPPHHRAVGGRMVAAISLSRHSGCHQKGL